MAFKMDYIIENAYFW